MIEVYLQKSQNSGWDLKAAILPKGGLGLAKETHLARLLQPSFQEAAEKLIEFSELSFTTNPDRWPVGENAFQIINDLSHPDRENFGNYNIEHKGRNIGRIEDFPRNSLAALIKRALQTTIHFWR